LMKISSNPLDFVQNRGALRRRLNEIDGVFLHKRTAIVTPRFLEAWSRLRQHVQDWELGYFFELTQPIINTEIVFVLAMVVLVVFGVVFGPYNGSFYLFLENMVADSNVYLTVALFELAVMVTLLVHLHALWNVFDEQKVHEKWVSDMIRQFQVEEAYISNRLARSDSADSPDPKKSSYSAHASSLKNTRDLLNTMHSDMIANRAAPKFLFGIFTLNDRIIQTIMGTIITFLTGLVYSYFDQISFSFPSDTTAAMPTAMPTAVSTAMPTP